MILLPESIKIIETKGKNIAVFEISGLWPGYGTTIGNALRRVLLSSIEGAGVTQVRVKGVEHEFSTIKGVFEDVLTIILNIKKLNFKSYSSEPQRAYLKVSGEREVRGADFKLPSQLEILNPQQHIATLTSPKAELELEVQVEKGVGYETVERRKRKLPIGEIAVDTSYSPVVRVAMRVEKTRVKERTDFDKLILEVETNGTVLPQEALTSACEILIEHFSLIQNTFLPTIQKKPKEEKKEGLKIPKEEKEASQISLKDLKFSTRTYNTLKKNKVSSLNDILKLGKEGIKNLKGMGKEGLKEIEKKLKKHGFEWK